MLRYQNDSRTVSIHSFTRQVTIETVETGEVSLPNALDLPDIESYVRCVTDHVAIENVYYNITQRCNLACPYCYAALNRSVVSMSDHYTILARLEALGVRSVTAIGGEPFSHPKFSELLASITECDFVEEVCIVTNGTMIHKRHLEVLSHPKVYLQISVDGHDEATNSPTRGRGSFARAMRAVALAKEAGIPFRVMQVLTRSTADTATEFYDHFAAIGCSPGFFMVKQVADTERPTTEQLRRLLDHVFTKTGDVHSVLDTVKFADNMQFETTGYPVAHCGAGISAICVDTDGSVYPCVKRTDRADRICNLLDADAIATLSAHAQRLIRKELVFSKPVCQDCRLAALCGGGCRAEEDSNGDPCQAGCDYFALAVAFYAEHVSSAPSR